MVLTTENKGTERPSLLRPQGCHTPSTTTTAQPQETASPWGGVGTARASPATRATNPRHGVPRITALTRLALSAEVPERRLRPGRGPADCAIRLWTVPRLGALTVPSLPPCPSPGCPSPPTPRHLAGDLIFHMLEKQPLLLRRELHLHRVPGQQLLQGAGQQQRVPLRPLHSAGIWVPLLDDLGHW